MPPSPRKYQPLADYLASQNEDEVTLTLTDIEQLVGTPLPRLASTRRFWANHASGHSPAYAWQGVGWRVATADVRRDRVTFQRGARPP